MQKKTMAELERASKEEALHSAHTAVTVVLDNIRSMNNVGSVFRTCDGFAVQELVLCGHTPQPPHRDIQKTALGATESVLWRHAENVVDEVLALKQQGFTCYAVEQVHASIALHRHVVDANAKYALVFGNEVEGVSQAVIDVCDGAIEIPQSGAKHSFNISVSTGIVLWHFYEKMMPQQA
jgi:23S rRNA (guanosine2251-2'-O)-methyltransferase